MCLLLGITSDSRTSIFPQERRSWRALKTTRGRGGSPGRASAIQGNFSHAVPLHASARACTGSHGDMRVLREPPLFPHESPSEKIPKNQMFIQNSKIKINSQPVSTLYSRLLSPSGMCLPRVLFSWKWGHGMARMPSFSLDNLSGYRSTSAYA